MFFEHPPWRAGLVGRACAFRNVGSHSLPSACPATVWVLLSVSQTGLWKRSQGQVRTWNRVINMGCPLQTVTALKIPLWTARWLPQHFFFFECWHNIQYGKDRLPCPRSHTKSWAGAQINSHDRMSKCIWVTYHKLRTWTSATAFSKALCCHSQ
jgi:hypothetical protein